MGSELTRFRDVLEYAIGGGWGKETPDAKHAVAVTVVRGTDFSKLRGGDLNEVPRRYEVGSKVTKRTLEVGDIILEVSGGSPARGQTTGRTCYIDDVVLETLHQPIIPASFCRLVRVDRSKVVPRFAYYWLQDMYQSGRAAAYENQSTGISNFQFERFLDAEAIVLPDLSIQQHVVETLVSIDDRIDNLRQTNATLEAIAQALFKSWFADFDPVRAKAEGREPEGMDRATAALFPSEFEDSELGPIPKGWRVETFGSAFEFTMGQSPPGTTYNTDGEGAAFFQGCTDFGDVFPVRRVFTTAPSRFAKAGDVLMSVRAPVGAVNLAVTDCAIGRGLCAIRHKSGSTGLTIEFVKASVQRIEAAAGEGALFKSLSKRQLADLPVVSAGEALVTAAIELLDPIVERRLLLARQAESLTQLRDTLLPRLISGRLRLSTIHSDSTSVGHNPTANNEDSDIKA